MTQPRMSDRMSTGIPSRNAETEKLYWSPEELREWQLDRLRATVEQAKKSEFYRDRLKGFKPDSIEDLQTLPLTVKEELRPASPFGLLAVDPADLFQYHETFGTTGVPVSSWMTGRDFEVYSDQINQAGADFGKCDMVLIRFPYAISVPAHITAHAAQKRGACVVHASSRTLIAPHTRVISLLRKLNCTVFTGIALEGIFLAETAKLMGYDPAADFPSLRAICCAGEMLTEARRERIAALWGAKVYNMYGTTELGNVAADCPEGSLHASSDHFIFEVLDEETHEPVEDGQMGLLVVTTITREATPLVRFLTGDHVILTPGATCACGRTTPTIRHYGRDLNCFDFGGKRIFTRDIEERLLALPPDVIGNIYIYVVKDDEVVVRAESGRDDAAGIRDVVGRVASDLGIPFRIERVPEGDLFDRQKLLDVDPVIKPRYVADWRTDERHPDTLKALLSGYHTFVGKGKG